MEINQGFTIGNKEMEWLRAKGNENELNFIKSVANRALIETALVEYFTHKELLTDVLDYQIQDSFNSADPDMKAAALREEKYLAECQEKLSASIENLEKFGMNVREIDSLKIDSDNFVKLLNEYKLTHSVNLIKKTSKLVCLTSDTSEAKSGVYFFENDFYLISENKAGQTDVIQISDQRAALECLLADKVTYNPDTLKSGFNTFILVNEYVKENAKSLCVDPIIHGKDGNVEGLEIVEIRGRYFEIKDRTESIFQITREKAFESYLRSSHFLQPPSKSFPDIYKRICGWKNDKLVKPILEMGYFSANNVEVVIDLRSNTPKIFIEQKHDNRPDWSEHTFKKITQKQLENLVNHYKQEIKHNPTMDNTAKVIDIKELEASLKLNTSPEEDFDLFKLYIVERSNGVQPGYEDALFGKYSKKMNSEPLIELFTKYHNEPSANLKVFGLKTGIKDSAKAVENLSKTLQLGYRLVSEETHLKNASPQAKKDAQALMDRFASETNQKLYNIEAESLLKGTFLALDEMKQIRIEFLKNIVGERNDQIVTQAKRINDLESVYSRLKIAYNVLADNVKKRFGLDDEQMKELKGIKSVNEDKSKGLNNETGRVR